jgi:DAK2 domain fusion protein YloV
MDGGLSSGEVNSNVTVGHIVTQFDGAALLRALEAATARLEARVDEVNALNVYPVPDGDTGTNMLHTMRSALRYALGADSRLSAISAGAAHGALMGARGNSGVILSQVLRGAKDAFANSERATAREMREVTALSRRYAYEAVSAPAPGTMLTLIDAMSEAASSYKGDDVLAFLKHIVEASAPAVARTREDNPTNRAAGVIDAGARGLQLILEGVLAGFTGEEIPLTRVAVASASAPAISEAPSWEGAYDVQFLVEKPSRPIARVREEMLKFGADCVLVVGDESVLKVHVHTLHPHEIIRIGLTAGRISDVVVEDLDAMTAEHERATGIVVAPPPRAPAAEIGVVAVVPGDGFAEVARSLGASSLRGGPTMNPSTEELLAAIRGANARTVVVLPNDKNVVLAAQQAAKAARDVDVRIIPTRNVAQGMAALVAFDPAKTATENATEMANVAVRAHGIEVTRAIRDATVDGEPVRQGEAMALLDGRVVAHSDDEVAALCEAAKRLTNAEIFTLYSGADVDDAAVERAAQRLRATCPRVSVEVARGGQPHYPFIVAAE